MLFKAFTELFHAETGTSLLNARNAPQAPNLHANKIDFYNDSVHLS